METVRRARPVYLVRHGQSEWNVLRLTRGQTMHPRLTPTGRAQAAAAADSLALGLASRPVRLLTSDLTRAVETADIIGGAARRRTGPRRAPARAAPRLVGGPRLRGDSGRGRAARLVRS
ncbi:phosphoglycerate mutase family protein [Nocardioides sp. B-3]|uniref:phosphoglycerate mutase family protein n=1 Tax=Nocardioides sp. B-3 TaxID=2895565 RepID=UPI0021536FC7|nr:phosphoglycerate mutase family protein [Nocardioides sp. B-3]